MCFMRIMNRFLTSFPTSAPFRQSQDKGSVLLGAILTIAVFSLIIGGFYQSLIPRFRATYQGAIWQEALHGAEGGADFAVLALNQFAANTRDPANYDWAGNHWSFANASYTTNGTRSLGAAYLPVLGGSQSVAVTSIAVDVYTRDSLPPYNPWFRIRSTARASLPGKYVSVDRRDGELRRMKLTNTTSGAPDPYVSRTVEVIVKPKSRFPRAITTAQNLTLARSSKWILNSFDSRFEANSEPGTTAGGVYPESKLTERLVNGSIATLKSLPDGTLYGALIDANGAIVKGDVQTVGGDDPSTTSTFENVSGDEGMDSTRISDDFEDDIPAVEVPAWTTISTINPSGNTAFLTGTSSSAPRRYRISDNLGAFTVVPPNTGTGYVEIFVSGNLDIGAGNSAEIVIPPNVYATIYVAGNIDFQNGEVNTNAASSKVASRLTVYGVGTSGTYNAAGNCNQTLAFYGPNYDVTLAGDTTTVGAMVSKSFSINGGGNGGFHYDEALGAGGDISGWAVTSYFDDARTDL